MSEYQYFEFRAVDHRLSDRQMRELRAVSTRAEISPTRFVNEYHWGDFKGDPSRWMERYFDAFLYFAGWGTRRLVLRLPSALLDLETAARYGADDGLVAWSADGFTILDFEADETPDEWVDEGPGTLDSVLPVRGDLAAGDRRALYLGWLLCAQNGYLDHDATEPPVPPGLGELTPALQRMAEFLLVDRDLLAAAAERSPPAAAGAPDPRDLARWVAALPAAEKDDLLTRIAAGDALHPRAELLRRFRETESGDGAEAGAPRTAEALLRAAEGRADERRRRRAEADAEARKRREREAAEARERHLTALAAREAEEWERVDALIATLKPKAYDEAVQLLADLRDVAARQGRADEADRRIDGLRQAHARKATLQQRLRRTGLPATRPRP
jgi:hypothetical protein